MLGRAGIAVKLRALGPVALPAELDLGAVLGVGELVEGEEVGVHKSRSYACRVAYAPVRRSGLTEHRSFLLRRAALVQARTSDRSSTPYRGGTTQGEQEGHE